MAQVVRVLRVIEYVGERKWVEATVAGSIQGEKHLSGGNIIRAATLGAYPEVLQDLPEIPPSSWGVLPE